MEFIGKNFNQKVIENKQRLSNQKGGGERMPDPEDIQKFNCAQDILSEALKILGIKYQPFPIENLHIYPEEIWLKKPFKEPQNTYGFFIPENDSILLRDRESKKRKVVTKFFVTIVHELTHRACVNQLYFNKKGKITTTRTGYSFFRSREGKEQGTQKLEAFDETILVHFVYTILMSFSKEIEQQIGITKKDLKKKGTNSIHYEKIFENILTGVDALFGKEEPGKDALARLFYKGLFDKENSRIVLRMIINTYGRNALEILSCIDYFKSEYKNKLLNQQIEYFFGEKDKDKRNEIEKMILGIIGVPLENIKLETL